MKHTKIPHILATLIFAGIIMFSLTPATVSACEIEVTVQEASDNSYTAGDTVILKVAVFLTHRNCPEGIDATQFTAQGMEVLGATQWTEVSHNRFERLVKVRITADEGDEAIFETQRTCSKEGGYDSLTLPVGAA